MTRSWKHKRKNNLKKNFGAVAYFPKSIYMFPQRKMEAMANMAIQDASVIKVNPYISSDSHIVVAANSATTLLLFLFHKIKSPSVP